MVESVVNCIKAQANEMFKGGVQDVSYNEKSERVVITVTNEISNIQDSIVKNLFMTVLKKFVEKHFPFLKCENVDSNSLLFTKSQWV